MLSRDIEMKQTLKTLIRNVKSINGNSLAEFATTTALMATLAATAAPKLSEMSEGTKAEKSRNEIDKLIKQAGSYYQDAADDEGRGRFPGQTKFNLPVGHANAGTYDNSNASNSGTDQAIINSQAHTTAILTDLSVVNDIGWEDYDKTHAAIWVSVFGTTNADAPLPTGVSGVIDDADGTVDWKSLMGDETLKSRFQDGHYVYSVVAGGGSGESVYPPVLFIGDIENMTDFNNVLEP